jgi:ABC-2 type transport system permease protein
MWAQIFAIAWAQLRISRNHLPRTDLGSVMAWLVALVWNGIFSAAAAGLAFALPRVPVAQLREYLPLGLLAVFAFWQLVPLFTLSSGWSLQLNKLRMYPVRDEALFGIEVLLRITSAPEMIIVLLGALIGLLRHPGVPPLWPFVLLLFIPFNLLIALAVRELFLQSFARNRFRELFAILLISLGLLPQLLLRTELGQKLKPYLFAIARGQAAPWREVAVLSLGSFTVGSLAVLLIWIFLAYRLARWQFAKSLLEEETFRPHATAPAALPQNALQRIGLRARSSNPLETLLHLPSRLFRDPLAALLEKELRSLLRMPRFRVLFGMACVFSVIVLVPITVEHGGHSSFMRSNLLPIINLYGLLILSDALMLNVFGFDRAAAQIYYITPVPFDQVLVAKNLAAVVFVLLQGLAALIVSSLLRVSISPRAIADAAAATVVVGLFFISVGNLMSTMMPRPFDPRQTFRKQAGGKMQLWFFLASIGMFALLALAFLAQWALESHWALLGVMALEFAVAIIFYGVALASAAGRGLRDREKIVEALSKGASPVGLGM